MTPVRVEIQPIGIEVDVAEGESLIEAAARQGYSWPSVCGGEGVCSTCAVDVVQVEEPLDGPTPAETETLRMLPRWHDGDDSLRLACQLRPTPGLVVRKIGVRKASP